MLRCEATINPIPAETEHERLPTWTRRGCASAATAAASIAMAAIQAKNLGDIFLPLVAQEPAKRMSEITEPSKLIRSKQRSCEDNQDRSAWRVLAESWLLVAAINDIVESRKSIEANSEAAPTHYRAA